MIIIFSKSEPRLDTVVGHDSLSCINVIQRLMMDREYYPQRHYYDRARVPLTATAQHAVTPEWCMSPTIEYSLHDYI
jgi:hypothetical protein